jgi:predicted DNA binding CopG/RHH family protein
MVILIGVTAIMTTKQTKGPRRPPNIKKLADSFDRNDTQNMEWEETDLKFERPEMVHVSLRIPKEDMIVIQKAARKAGLGHTTYMRMLIRQALTSK